MGNTIPEVQHCHLTAKRFSLSPLEAWGFSLEVTRVKRLEHADEGYLLLVSSSPVRLQKMDHVPVLEV